MQKIMRVMVIGLLVLLGSRTESFGFGGLGGFGGRGYTDAFSLSVADRLGAFTPPVDPFASTRPSGGYMGAGNLGYGGASPPIPNRVVAPQISASQLLNPSTGGLANLGRTMTSSQMRPPAAPLQPPSYSMPSDMGLQAFSPFSTPQQ